jgi:hypothetical protein
MQKRKSTYGQSGIEGQLLSRLIADIWQHSFVTANVFVFEDVAMMRDAMYHTGNAEASPAVVASLGRQVERLEPRQWCAPEYR